MNVSKSSVCIYCKWTSTNNLFLFWNEARISFWAGFLSLCLCVSLKQMNFPCFPSAVFMCRFLYLITFHSETQWKRDWTMCWIMNLKSPLCPPPPPCLFLGLKTEEGNAVCVWMKLKLEAEWHCSGTGKSSRLPACVCVCVCVGNGWGGWWGRERQNFSIWGTTAAQTKLQTQSHPRHTHTHTHTHRGRYPHRDKHAARPTQTSGEQQIFSDHTQLCEFFCSRKKENYFTSNWLQSQLTTFQPNSSKKWHKEINSNCSRPPMERDLKKNQNIVFLFKNHTFKFHKSAKRKRRRSRNQETHDLFIWFIKHNFDDSWALVNHTTDFLVLQNARQWFSYA